MVWLPDGGKNLKICLFVIHKRDTHRQRALAQRRAAIKPVDEVPYGRTSLFSAVLLLDQLQ